MMPGDEELDVDTFTLAFHTRHLALATRHHIDHLRCKLLRHIDGHFLDGFVPFRSEGRGARGKRFAGATDILLPLTTCSWPPFIYDLWLTHLQFVAFATHGLDEDREVQDATP